MSSVDASNRRDKLIEYISQISTIIDRSQCGEKVKANIRQLKSDIDDDFFTIVVLGEFKRGKSTLVNALLKKDILISDVLPETAVIQAIMNDEEFKAQIVYKDGTYKDGYPDKQFLSKVSAKEDGTEVIDYVKIGVPTDFLGDKIVLVDTPGVADLNQQRIEVTYNFVPKANAVIFVLDATSPMKRTEKEFIEEFLINQGINKVVFVINKMDSFDDEEEDFPQYMSTVRSRIEAVLKGDEKLEKIEIIPVSALQALRGYETDNTELIEQSNIDELKKKISEIIMDGDIERAKLDRFRDRLQNILLDWKKECDDTVAMYELSEQQLTESLQRVEKEIQSQNERFEIIKEYVSSEKQSIYAMVGKSMNKLHKDLLRDVDYQLDRYKGSDFKGYIEKDLPHYITHYIESWINSRYYGVDKALSQLEAKLSEALSRCFNKNVFVRGEAEEVDFDPVFQMEAEDISSAQYTAGIITAGGAAALYLTGLGFLAPLLSMVAFPMLRQGIMDSELERAKKEAVPQIHTEIEHFIEQLRYEIDRNLSSRIETISGSVERNYTCLLEMYEKNMKGVLIDKQADNESIKKSAAIDESRKLDKVIQGVGMV